MILWLMTLWLDGIGRGRDGGNVLVGWVIRLRSPMGHHVDFLFFLFGEVTPKFLGTASRIISFY